MKHILFLGTLATLFVAGACSENIYDEIEKGPMLTFNVNAGSQESRAYGDGIYANSLQYAVYDAKGNELELLRGETSINITAKVDMKLANGDTFYILFWADNEKAPYTVDFSTKQMTIDYTDIKANNENHDAFYRLYGPFKVTGSESHDVELYRPFSQVNILTTDKEYASQTGMDIETTEFEMDVFTTLDLWTGEGIDEQNRIFSHADCPTEKVVIDGVEYDYLAMNYLLVAKDHTLKEVKCRYKDVARNIELERKFGSVPVERNYKTNIYGTLLTKDTEFKVEIKPSFPGTHDESR